MTAIDVIFEDDDLMVVTKPAGMVTHPAYRHPDGTLWDYLVRLFEARGLHDHPRMLHRLDCATSGLLCVPKHLAAHRLLERALRRGSFRKGYLALVHGATPRAGTIDAPLGRDAANPRQVAVRDDGQAARTHFAVLRACPDFALLRVKPESGRMHQIRVHLAHIGHPIAGDPVYGPAPSTFARLLLHADRLCFPHPVRAGMVRCRAPLPPDFRAALSGLGESNICSCA